MRSRAIGGGAAALAALVGAAPAPAAATEVMGFLPEWELGAEIRWDLVDTLAYFDASVRADGSVGDTSGFPDDPDVEQLLARAERENTRVVVTFTNFDDDEIAELLEDPAARSRFIDEALALVERGGAGGLNLDFEFVASEDRDAFTAFVADLAAAFRGSDGDHQISVSVPALNFGDAYDAAGILEAADRLFVMGYDYHYAGGDPGPVAPLSSGDLWPAGANLEATMEIYTEPIDPSERGRVHLGLPLYGYDWPADSDEPLARARGEGEAVFYRDFAEGGGELRWDREAAAPWRVYEGESGYRQAWGENAESIRAKVEAAAGRDLGVGFWALGYADADAELWGAIADGLAPGAPPGDADAGAGTPPDAAGESGGEISGGCAADPRASLLSALAALGALAWLSLGFRFRGRARRFRIPTPLFRRRGAT